MKMSPNYITQEFEEDLEEVAKVDTNVQPCLRFITQEPEVEHGDDKTEDILVNAKTRSAESRTNLINSPKPLVQVDLHWKKVPPLKNKITVAAHKKHNGTNVKRHYRTKQFCIKPALTPKAPPVVDEHYQASQNLAFSLNVARIKAMFASFDNIKSKKTVKTKRARTIG